MENDITDVGDLEYVFRIIQSILSKKAEPFKQWMAGVASERVNQMIVPFVLFQFFKVISTRTTLSSGLRPGITVIRSAALAGKHNLLPI